MPVTHTPPKIAGAASTAEAEAAATATEEAVHTNSFFEWQLEVNGQILSINVNANQNKYLNSGITQEQQEEFLQWILEDQAAATAKAQAAATSAEENPEDLHSNSPSPTPTVKSFDTIEQIRNRTRIQEGSLRNNPDLKDLFDENNNDDDARMERQNQFVHLTKTNLPAPSRQFNRAVHILKIELDRQKSTVEIGRQQGDFLLQEVIDCYEKLEEARWLCEEVLNDDERMDPRCARYLQSKLEDLIQCRRIHQKYFEQQEDTNVLPTRMTSTPFHQNAIPPLGAHFDQRFGHQQAHGQSQDQPRQHHGQQQQSPPPRAHADSNFGQDHGP